MGETCSVRRRRQPDPAKDTPQRQRRRRIRRRIRRVVGIALLAFFAWFAYSFGTTLTNPSYGTSLMSRAAEWGRDHGLGSVVTWAEEEYDRLNPPKVGGVPPKGSFTKVTTPPPPKVAAALGMPRRLRSPA